MRIYLKLSKNIKKIPFNYQELLTGVIHKWIGENNNIHGKPGRHCFSWIQNSSVNKDGIELKRDAYFFIGSQDVGLIKSIIKGILADPTMFSGVKVTDVQIKDTPEFDLAQSFWMASPVLLKVKDGENTRHVTLEDDDFEEVLTENLKRKLEKAEISSDGLTVILNPQTNFRKTKLVTYKGIKNKASFAPVIISGTKEQIEYAWSVGLGNSTGIGFGALK